MRLEIDTMKVTEGELLKVIELLQESIQHIKKTDKFVQAMDKKYKYLPKGEQDNG